ncbi:hypothetical protein LR48_Vigan738s001600 [Vigna angularis]|uniref:Uncharacterized protein n=1 Tax=Phaseolus angularis TaxID=3914 RepID=A0A0L9TGN4_PHAAN|nr:hypothetical protein LR48_Vigan738s001600 [Vigna angularis]
MIHGRNSMILKERIHGGEKRSRELVNLEGDPYTAFQDLQGGLQECWGEPAELCECKDKSCAFTLHSVGECQLNYASCPKVSPGGSARAVVPKFHKATTGARPAIARGRRREFPLEQELEVADVANALKTHQALHARMPLVTLEVSEVRVEVQVSERETLVRLELELEEMLEEENLDDANLVEVEVKAEP